jgi:hypothetical protein
VVELNLTTEDLELLRRESGFKTTADNPTSTAFGIWQGLQSTRNKYAAKASQHLGYKVDPETKNDYEQAVMYVLYRDDRYGSAKNALNFHVANGHY